jgi:FkbM family methyltransferase
MRDFALPDNPNVRLVATESLLARMLYWYGEGGYEGAETQWWTRFCQDATSILELGANIGYYTVQGGRANPGARYRAVEANPRAAKIVGANVALNGLANVEVLPVAVVGHKVSDTMTLAFPEEEQYEAPSGAYLIGAEGVADRISKESVTVPVEGIVDLIEDADLLKLDIEGLETDVLLAAMDALLERMPVIFLEVRTKAVSLRTVISQLHHGGYVVLAIGEHSLHLVTREQIDSGDRLPRYGGRDVILVPAGLVGTL